MDPKPDRLTLGRQRFGRGRSHAGQVTVEFALVAPLAVALIAVLVQVGLATTANLRLTHGCRAAARAAIIEPILGSARKAGEKAGLPSVTDIAVETRPGEILGTTEVVVVCTSEVPWIVPLVRPGDSRLRSRFVAIVER